MTDTNATFQRMEFIISDAQQRTQWPVVMENFSRSRHRRYLTHGFEDSSELIRLFIRTYEREQEAHAAEHPQFRRHDPFNNSQRPAMTQLYNALSRAATYGAFDPVPLRTGMRATLTASDEDLRAIGISTRHNGTTVVLEAPYNTGWDVRRVDTQDFFWASTSMLRGITE